MSELYVKTALKPNQKIMCTSCVPPKRAVFMIKMRYHGKEKFRELYLCKNCEDFVCHEHIKVCSRWMTGAMARPVEKAPDGVLYLELETQT